MRVGRGVLDMDCTRCCVCVSCHLFPLPPPLRYPLRLSSCAHASLRLFVSVAFLYDTVYRTAALSPPPYPVLVFLADAYRNTHIYIYMYCACVCVCVWLLEWIGLDWCVCVWAERSGGGHRSFESLITRILLLVSVCLSSAPHNHGQTQ